MRKFRVVTTSGLFHADEVFAIATLAILHGDAPDLIRTRKQNYVQAAILDDTTYVVGVGGNYNPNLLNFDFTKNTSSFSLVWKEYGSAIVSRFSIPDQLNAEITNAIKTILVDYIEAINLGKCRKTRTDIVEVIEQLNKCWYESEDSEDQSSRMLQAVAIALTYITRLIANTLGIIMAIDLIDHAERLDDGKIIILDKDIPWEEYVSGADDSALFVILPGPSGNTNVYAIPVDATNTKFRMLFPEKWRTKINRDEVTGIEGCVFILSDGSIAGNRSKEGAIEMARKAIKLASS